MSLKFLSALSPIDEQAASDFSVSAFGSSLRTSKATANQQNLRPNCAGNAADYNPFLGIPLSISSSAQQAVNMVQPPAQFHSADDVLFGLRTNSSTMSSLSDFDTGSSYSTVATDESFEIPQSYGNDLSNYGAQPGRSLLRSRRASSGSLSALSPSSGFVSSPQAPLHTFPNSFSPNSANSSSPITVDSETLLKLIMVHPNKDLILSTISSYAPGLMSPQASANPLLPINLSDANSPGSTQAQQQPDQQQQQQGGSPDPQALLQWILAMVQQQQPHDPKRQFANTPEERLMLRKERNREIARKSRQRKKIQMLALQEKIIRMEAETSENHSRLEMLTVDNRQLRSQYESICRRIDEIARENMMLKQQAESLSSQLSKKA
eukprot:c12427_g5_i1.p1 GENE.c12427_g5_i1~~c12427_g5_i1.p1  ORF type:complete len:379 (-),score=65.79 c12427_g5_i1:837-1973(-)